MILETRYRYDTDTPTFRKTRYRYDTDISRKGKNRYRYDTDTPKPDTDPDTDTVM